MAHDSRWQAQDHQYARAYRNLQKAREEAARKNGYDSTRTRSDLKSIFRDRFGKDSYEWQLDVTVAILLGLDSVVITGTGAGKTMPFMMPLLLDDKKKVIIISPLKILQADQVEQFEKLCIQTTAVNGDTWNSELLQHALKRMGTRLPSLSAMDNAMAENYHVASNVSNNNCVDLCVVGGISLEDPVHPFVHPVGLKGKVGSLIEVDGLFDEGAMVNSICKDKFSSMKGALGKLTVSEKALRMADGTIVPSHRQWSGGVTLGGLTAKAAFEIFPSGGGWSLLFGKPLLQAFQAIHNYDDDTLRIPHNGDWTILMNKYGTGVEASTLKGDVESPLRQVLMSILMSLEQVNKQNLLEKFTEVTEHMHHNPLKPKQQG
ncbi:hypothetical protein PILCRDRAFT_5136 [Piloderma croceum F 1598]|uniref:DEAD/DEAH-box helicase domain-containing protein n=1 Tax=Piloderma croceum (strain F 1598) TaxID=765440 RepID=A0A0C3BIC6_PILCF|nr:hypothetical protein PILCRDRAFT_5136 [Piloderma croceum F 1598]